MKKLGSRVIVFMLILTISGSFIPSGLAQNSPSSKLNLPVQEAPEHAKEVPAEIRSLFEGGMSIEQFLSLNDGPVPKALKDDPNSFVSMIVELDQAPLADAYAVELTGNQTMSAVSQHAYLDSLEKAQATVIRSLESGSINGKVIDTYTKAYNGILVRLPVNRLDAVRDLQGVKAIHRAPVHVPALSKSVPLIEADKVVSQLGIDGTGVTIAVIDTGIDYTHAALGGSGDPADYENNDPTVIEMGTFPTAKVIGGYDFAGADYDASGDLIAETIPMPDSDPLDGDGHGTHVASTAAGVGVTGKIGPGVAPAASLYALKVFGEPAGSTNLTVSAIEWAMDPNKDGDLSDHVDVINMSLGSDFGPASNIDPDIVASNNAAKIGIFVAAASGNAGDSSYITGSPAAASTSMSVAASTTGFITGPTISVQSTIIPTNTNIVYQPPSFDNNTGHFTTTTTATLYYIGENSAAENDELCTTDGFSSEDLTETLALIQRGTCSFSIKVNNAASLGAIGAIIFNHATGGNSITTMIGDPVDIPAGFITHDDGVSLALDHGKTTEVSAETDVTIVEDKYTPEDAIAGFSSRGPRGFDSFLKPEITAPGVGIFAAAMGTGTEGTSLSGTSMATPHIAGVAALLQEYHPDWSVEQLKAAMMNTAVDLVGSTNKVVPRQGAGRVDALFSAETTSLAIGDSDLVSLSWGVLPINEDTYTDHKMITLQNLDVITKTYAVEWEFGTGSHKEGFDLTLPDEVVVNPSPGFAYVDVDLNIEATQISAKFYQLEEYYGFVIFRNATDASDVLRVPFYAVPQPSSALNLTDFAVDGISGSVDLQHTGPISSSVWAFPLYELDDNQPAQGDEADLRMLGMDYGWDSMDYGPIFVPGIDIYGSWHVPQPYFAEFDLYLDVNQDGNPDFIDFNYNFGWFNGLDDDNTWVVIQLDLNQGLIFLGSPYTIYTDFNTGFMEWYLPAGWNGLDPDSDFDYQLIGFDYSGDFDASAWHYFDFALPPFKWSVTDNPGPSDSSANVSFQVANGSGYENTHPLGLMVVDYNGSPGLGQAYSLTFTIDNPFVLNLPLISK
jgi:minor extracellular serine protease Vpr